MNDYSFERFTSTRSKLSNYAISLNKSRYFGLLSGFFQRENIERYTHVVLYFDSIREAVAFQFTNNEKAPGAFTVVSNSGGSGVITCHSFFTKYSLHLKDYQGKYTPLKVNDAELGELFVINLKGGPDL